MLICRGRALCRSVRDILSHRRAEWRGFQRQETSRGWKTGGICIGTVGAYDQLNFMKEMKHGYE